eukprot:TRINITY_DN1599_c0_g1_i1.p1 TRINITY_DN1599_c0_g1~~TRINITY_DN1599_c0_g1_i1.p1  ORF type:complete len:525 (+),score=69.56 TRINITY_DN1599_c0_g1_i1:105-1679(+)
MGEGEEAAQSKSIKLFPVKSRLTAEHRKPPSSAESKYWKSFKTTPLTNLITPITSIEFSPEPPHDFAVTSSASVTIYDALSFHLKSTLSSFTDVAYSATFRSDGKLIAAGGESGLVQVFDPKTRAPLRRLAGHTRPVRIVRYPRLDKLRLFSGGDDAILKYWDITSETQILSFSAHKDYIRGGSASPASSDLFVTGSYDHTVRLWDVRVSPSNPVMDLNHGKPVENVLFLPSGGLLATAGGNYVKVWDVIGGGRLVYCVESHNKTVTSMCVGKVGNKKDSEELRLLSISLDGYMKVFDYSAFKVTHSMRFPAPLLSIGFSPSCSGRVIGTSNGTIFMGRRKKESLVDELGGGFVEEPEKQVLKPMNYRYFRRGQNEKPLENDYVVKKTRKVKLAEHDKLLTKFRHKEALVSVLNEKNPRNVVAVMEELVARKKLLKCVENLDVDELGLLLGFLHKFSTVPKYSGFLMGLANRVLQLRAEDVRVSDALRGHVKNLRRVVLEEIQIQQSLQELQGIVSPLVRIAGR